MTDRNQILEEVAQMLYHKAEIASEMEERSITQPVKSVYHVKYLTYCGAAEEVRRMKENENG